MTIGTCTKCHRKIKDSDPIVITMAGEWHSGCARRAL